MHLSINFEFQLNLKTIVYRTKLYLQYKNGNCKLTSILNRHTFLHFRTACMSPRSAILWKERAQ